VRLSTPLKSYLTFQEQLEKLKAKGLIVNDDQAAITCLQRLGYYRLAGYFYPLRATNPRGTPGRQNHFQDGAHFDLVVSLYNFDKRLRLLMIDAAERIEVALRVAIAYRLGKFDCEAHKNPALLDQRFIKKGLDGKSLHDKWCSRLEKAVQESHDDFVKHHEDKYGGKMPIWVAIELWDFGTLSRFYAGMQFRDKEAIAHQFGQLKSDHLQSWLRTLNFVRNVAAHHSRLWNRNVPEIPKFPTQATHPLLGHVHQHKGVEHRMYGALVCAAYLLRPIDLDKDWLRSLKQHIATFPANPLIHLTSAGFPPDWENEMLWL
jgi:abortive infection bacteriophage resistance protein